MAGGDVKEIWWGDGCWSGARGGDDDEEGKWEQVGRCRKERAGGGEGLVKFMKGTFGVDKTV